MKLKAEQLQGVLDSGPDSGKPPLYWLAGDEPLLLQESADHIRRHYREAGYTEREIFNVERGFKWEGFRQSLGNFSLFADKKIIELRLAAAKPDDAGKQAIEEFLDQDNPDCMLLLSSPRLESSFMSTKWFKAVESKSTVVQIWPVNKEALPGWLSNRLSREGINVDRAALRMLSDKVEGNLPAAMQEIEKLKLLVNHTNTGEKTGEKTAINLDAKTVMQVIADSSRYTVYNLVDAALAGNPARCRKILVSLREEGTAPLLISGAIGRELRLLLPMVEKIRQGQGANAVMQSHRVWFNRKQAVGNALQRLQPGDIWRLLDKLRGVDQAVKGLSSANPWDELSLLVLELGGHKLHPPGRVPA